MSTDEDLRHIQDQAQGVNAYDMGQSSVRGLGHGMPMIQTSIGELPQAIPVSWERIDALDNTHYPLFMNSLSSNALPMYRIPENPMEGATMAAGIADRVRDSYRLRLEISAYKFKKMVDLISSVTIKIIDYAMIRTRRNKKKKDSSHDP